MLRRLTRPFRHGLLFLGFLSLRGCVALTPRRLALAVAGALGDVAYALDGSTRRAAAARVRDVLGRDGVEARRVCREMYRHFAWDIVDLLIFGGWRRRRFGRYVAAEGFERVEAALARGGVVGITAHFCNWELLGGYVAGRLGGIAVLAQLAYDGNFNRLLVHFRRRLGVRTIYRAEPAAAPLKWLRGGGFLGVLADQDIAGVPSVAVPFFGRPARTPVGPALLARRAGAAILPMFIVRVPGYRYRVVIEPPVARSAAPKVKDALAEDTAAWSAVVEKWVREYPAQWVWVHERWGTAAGENMAAAARQGVNKS